MCSMQKPITTDWIFNKISLKKHFDLFIHEIRDQKPNILKSTIKMQKLPPLISRNKKN